MHLYRFDYIWGIAFHFPDAGLSRRKQDMGEAILQIPSSL
jgi:hypothetical protein